MSDQIEEQEMEAEALEAIFDSAFEIIEGSNQPFQWSVALWPSLDDGDENHVGIKLLVTVPPNYPEYSDAELDIEIIKGLTDVHRIKLLELANDEAKQNEGMPQIYAITEVLKEWLLQNNEPGQADDSMHAQMLRRAKEEKQEKERQKEQEQYESQKIKEELTEAEAEEEAVRKRRAEGTPVTMETFQEWKLKFDHEMSSIALKEKQEKDASNTTADKKNKTKEKIDKSARLTGFQQFTTAASSSGAVAMEEAANEAETMEMTQEELEEAGFDEDLFVDDDDDLDDLDDLDFDDDDDDDDDDEEEPDI